MLPLWVSVAGVHEIVMHVPLLPDIWAAEMVEQSLGATPMFMATSAMKFDCTVVACSW